MNKMYLPLSVRFQLQAWVESGYPLETCGVLIGQQGNERVQILQALNIQNAHTKRTHDRYELDAEGFLAADQTAHSQGLEIVGIWHSHPDHPAQPSETDRVGAWHGWSYLIVSVFQGRTVELRSWRLQDKLFIEEIIAA